jgi:hypothetical protein
MFITAATITINNMTSLFLITAGKDNIFLAIRPFGHKRAASPVADSARKFRSRADVPPLLQPRRGHDETPQRIDAADALRGVY